MAYNDPTDNEFDQDMERILQEHFDNESPDLRAPRDTWDRLQARMDEPPAPSPISRWLSSLLTVRGGRFSPAFAGVAAALVVVVVISVLFVSLGNEGESFDGGFAAAPATEAPLVRSLQTSVPAATAAPAAQEASTESDVTGSAGAQGAAGAANLPGGAGARDRVEPPAATAAPAMAMTEETTSRPAPAATTAPIPTRAPRICANCRSHACLGGCRCPGWHSGTATHRRTPCKQLHGQTSRALGAAGASRRARTGR